MEHLINDEIQFMSWWTSAIQNLPQPPIIHVKTYNLPDA